jgi:hypothetical protein
MWFMIAMAVVAAVGAMQKGQAQAASFKAQAAAMEVQAKWTRFQGKQEELKQRKQAADELESTLMHQARINAVAGAGLMDPFSGNPMGLKIQALDVGGTNYAMAKTNAIIVRKQANAAADMQLNQAAQARQAASAAKIQGFLGGASAGGQAYMGYQQTSTPSSSGAVT